MLTIKLKCYPGRRKGIQGASGVLVKLNFLATMDNTLVAVSLFFFTLYRYIF